MNRLTFIACVAALALWGAGAAAIGDAAPPEFGAAGSALPANEITNFKGKLKGMRRGLVLVEKEDGSEALVMPPENIASFKFVAKATAAFLRPGMLVRFDGNFGPGGVPLQPISKVTVFQPVNLKSIQGHAREQFTPGVHSADRRGQRNQPMMGKLTVVGSLIGLSPSGVLAVRAGKVPVQVPVGNDTELEICFNNLSLAQEGDAVNVSGFYQPPNENQVRADRIMITTDRVYGEYQPEGTKKPGRSRRSKSEKDQKKPQDEVEKEIDDANIDNPPGGPDTEGDS